MDEKNKKQTLRMFSYGVYLLTSHYQNNYCASTVTWVSQASFKPPMISVCIKKESISHDIVIKNKKFILHILSENQKDIASSFFKPTVLSNGKLNGHRFFLKDDIPIIKNIPAYIICKVIEILDNGDHPLFLSEVIDANFIEDVQPLELRKTGWSYGG